MNRLLRAAAALVCAVGFGICAHAQMTTVTATNIKMKGVAVAAGTVTLIPTDALGNPVPITAGGSLYDAQGFTGTITSGAIGAGFQVPDECTAAPSRPNVALSYQIQVYNSSTKTSFTLANVAGVCGASWALDSYAPTQSAVIASTGLVSGATPPAHCSNTSIFYKTTAPSATYNCVSGVYVLQTSSAGTIAVTSGMLKGDNAGNAMLAIAGTDYIPGSQKGAASGVATLDANTKVPAAQIPNNLISSGVLADIQFMDGAGTTVSDSSGNGNNATFITGHEPTWVQNGLQFSTNTQGISLPAAVNSGQTFEIQACPDSMPASGGIFKTNQYPIFISSSLGMTGLNLLYTGAGNGVYQIGIAAGGGNQDLTTQTFSGCHLYTYTLGTGGAVLDHLYIDGVEVPYTQQGASAGKQASGNLFFGNSGISPYGTSGFIGTVYRLRILSAQLTSAQVASDANVLSSQTSARGVSLLPQQYLQINPQLHLVGDSLTCSWNGTACNASYSWGSQLTLTNQPAYTITNWGVYGALMQAMQSSEPNRVSPYCKTNNGPSLAINAGATNDLQSSTAATVIKTAAAMAQSLQAAGCTPFVTTILSRTGTSSATGTPTNDAQKDSYNALLAAQWKSMGYKGLIDWGADPNLGADGAYANTTYFLADATHNTATGEARKAAIASNALNYYFSQYSESSPHVITAGTTLASSDAAVSVGTLTAAIALVMPDCTGPTGATYLISNPQSAFAVTIAGGASQPINGLTSAITIAANSTVRLTDVANPRSTAGCHWVM